MIRHFTTYPVINILTRSGRRESCFKSLKKTLNSQTFNNYNHIISNDNIDNLFLKNEKNVIDVIFKPKSHSRDCTCFQTHQSPLHHKKSNTIMNIAIISEF